jgi:hypothetical protein
MLYPMLVSPDHAFTESFVHIDIEIGQNVYVFVGEYFESDRTMVVLQRRYVIVQQCELGLGINLKKIK